MRQSNKPSFQTLAKKFSKFLVLASSISRKSVMKNFWKSDIIPVITNPDYTSPENFSSLGQFKDLQPVLTPTRSHSLSLNYRFFFNVKIVQSLNRDIKSYYSYPNSALVLNHLFVWHITRVYFLRPGFSGKVERPFYITVVFYPKAARRDSGVPFSLINFLEDILQPTKSNMSPTSNLCL